MAGINKWKSPYTLGDSPLFKVDHSQHRCEPKPVWTTGCGFLFNTAAVIVAQVCLVEAPKLFNRSARNMHQNRM